MAIIKRAVSIRNNGAIRWQDAGEGEWVITNPETGVYDITFPVTFISDVAYICTVSPGQVNDLEPISPALFGVSRLSTANSCQIRISANGVLVNFPATIEIYGEVA